MWNFLQHIINSIMAEKGILDQFIDGAFVVVINIMNRDPATFATISLPNFQGQ